VQISDIGIDDLCSGREVPAQLGASSRTLGGRVPAALLSQTQEHPVPETLGALQSIEVRFGCGGARVAFVQ
jgi:hypothetical protein